MSTTFRDLFKSSLRLIGALGVGETPTADDIADGIESFNDMLDSWSNENLIIPSVLIEDFTLVAGQGLYTMGPSGNFDTVRPMGIKGAAIVNGTQEIPMQVLNQDQWQAISQKATQSTIPFKLYPNSTYPLYSLNVWPVPSIARTIRLYDWKQLTNISNASSVIDFPPGYKMALKYNFAIVISPEYGKEPSDKVSAIADKSKASIKRKNIKPMSMSVDAALTGGRRFNIYTGE